MLSGVICWLKSWGHLLQRALITVNIWAQSILQMSVVIYCMLSITAFLRISYQSEALQLLRPWQEVLQRYWFIDFGVIWGFRGSVLCVILSSMSNVFAVDKISRRDSGMCTRPRPTPAGYRCRTKTAYKGKGEEVHTLIFARSPKCCLFLVRMDDCTQKNLIIGSLRMPFWLWNKILETLATILIII